MKLFNLSSNCAKIVPVKFNIHTIQKAVTEN